MVNPYKIKLFKKPQKQVGHPNIRCPVALKHIGHQKKKKRETLVRGNKFKLGGHRHLLCLPRKVPHQLMLQSGLMLRLPCPPKSLYQ